VEKHRKEKSPLKKGKTEKKELKSVGVGSQRNFMEENAAHRVATRRAGGQDAYKTRGKKKPKPEGGDSRILTAETIDQGERGGPANQQEKTTAKK